MRNIKLTIEYDGTRFEGWQIQRENHRTVQGEIKKALKKILKEDVTLIGSGRTDSGVHASGQVANFKTRSLKPLKEIQNALNANLPDDIAILKCEQVPLDFHAQFDVRSKTYRYTILHRKVRSVRDKNLVFLYPFKLNLQEMRGEAKALIGRRDFKSFQSANPSNNGNTIRTIKRLDIKKRGNYIFIDIEANGFLYKMVRNIVGTLLQVGKGKIPPRSIQKILKAKSRTQAGDTAKPHGLTLLKVKY